MDDDDLAVMGVLDLISRPQGLHERARLDAERGP